METSNQKFTGTRTEPDHNTWSEAASAMRGSPLPKMTVSELTERIKAALEGFFPQVVVEGELSNFRPSSTGHLYFTLKDAGSSISAIMFKTVSAPLHLSLETGCS